MPTKIHLSGLGRAIFPYRLGPVMPVVVALHEATYHQGRFFVGCLCNNRSLASYGRLSLLLP
jgi:hypothetical protein